jgi:hypothetical protein
MRVQVQVEWDGSLLAGIRTRLEEFVLRLFRHQCHVRGGWIALETQDAVHVLPMDDECEHAARRDCLCGPALDDDGAAPLYTHASLDGREQREASA